MAVGQVFKGPIVISSALHSEDIVEEIRTICLENKVIILRNVYL